jgi:hypothetical protein
MKITVSKAQLLKTLQDNREKHEETFTDALDGYYTAVIAALGEKLRLAKERKKVDLYISYSVPRNHAGDYDRAIGMLKWHTGETFELTEQEYSSYVMDNWSWTGEWRGTAKSFSASAYARNYHDDDEE